LEILPFVKIYSFWGGLPGEMFVGITKMHCKLYMIGIVFLYPFQR